MTPEARRRFVFGRVGVRAPGPPSALAERFIVSTDYVHLADDSGVAVFLSVQDRVIVLASRSAESAMRETLTASDITRDAKCRGLVLVGNGWSGGWVGGAPDA
jgi:hypothetical protein